MRIGIVGAGAIGGFVGASLAATGHHAVSALARGATLEALRAHGWRVRSTPRGPLTLQAPAATVSDVPSALGVQDVVVIAVKGPALPALAPTLAPLIGPQTRILTAMNGVPWWFCQPVPGWDGRTLRAVDPQGTLSDALPTAQLVAGVVHMACSTDEPGVVLHRMGRGLILGRCAGGADAGVDTLVTALCDAGLEATASPDIRRDIWYKLWGNMTMNPVTALTGATMDVVLADPLLRRFCSDAMREAAAIGARIGCPIDQSPEDRHQITAKLGPVKTSMLQDVEAQRPLELDAIVGAVHEIAGQLGLDVPNIGALFGLVRLMARTRGLYPST